MAYDETTFALMLERWRHVLGVAHAEVLGRWEASIAEMVAERDALLSDGRWHAGPGDVLGVLGRTYQELHHSALLAWALDPSAGHRLGSRFLTRFCDLIGIDPGAAHRAATRCEVTVGDTRADVVVTLSTGRIVVENKTGAPEQHRQAARLAERFGEAHLVWLDHLRRPPTTAEQYAHRWTTIGYDQVLDLLSDALEDTPDPSSGIVDWHTTLTAIVGDTNPWDLTDQQLFLFRHEGQIREWAELLGNATNELADYFHDRVYAFASATWGDSLIVHRGTDRSYPHVLLARKEWSMSALQVADEPAVSVGWEVYRPRFSPTSGQPFTGIRVKPGALVEPAATRIAALQGPEHAGRSNWWPTWTYVAPPAPEWWNSIDEWLDAQTATLNRAWETLSPLVAGALSTAELGAMDPQSRSS